MGTILIGVVLLTLLPDIDVLVPFVAHRGITHSFVAAVCLGVAVGVAGWMSSLGSIANGSERAAVGFLMGSLSVMSHLLGDVITPMGIRPFYPASQTWYTVNAVSTFNIEANRMLFLIGGVAVWMAIHHGRLRVATREAAAEEPSAESVADPSDGPEHDRPTPAHPPIRAGPSTPDRPGPDITAMEMGD